MPHMVLLAPELLRNPSFFINRSRGLAIPRLPFYSNFILLLSLLVLILFLVFPLIHDWTKLNLAPIRIPF